jgi:hypothetical protein
MQKTALKERSLQGETEQSRTEQERARPPAADVCSAVPRVLLLAGESGWWRVKVVTGLVWPQSPMTTQATLRRLGATNHHRARVRGVLRRRLAATMRAHHGGRRVSRLLHSGYCLSTYIPCRAGIHSTQHPSTQASQQASKPASKPANYATRGGGPNCPPNRSTPDSCSSSPSAVPVWAHFHHPPSPLRATPRLGVALCRTGCPLCATAFEHGLM